MNKLIKSMTLILGVLFLVGCGYEKTTYKYEDVKALYWHGKNTYSVATEDSSGFVKLIYLPYGTKKNIHTGGELTSISCERWYSEWSGVDSSRSFCDISIGSVDDINPSSWDHGKFGRGTISRVDK